MKIPKYFNKKILPQCSYCHYCKIDDQDVYICTINRTIKNEKCSKFFYDPLMRIPDTTPQLADLELDDFSL